MWYKETIIYELHVRSFADGDGDGIGDFKGLTSRLDYLERLGIGAVWLLPFYPSPLRDDGYDTADYTSVHPSYGTLADFKRFLREAHLRGIKVITELVLNHTSDQHPWFQRARQAKAGSAARDFYVWSQTAKKYEGTRIIFKDFEHSNWAWDSLAGAYYWHRFYHHQPDLNFDNPAVQKAMIKILDFWFGLGVDGLRLDAVPYLFEREGTNCENLPETHAFLKELRAHVDSKFPGRMLLAEANQWPEDAISYFGEGTGDECHMAFHFPVMPRIFMALWMEDRHPIIDIQEQTPPIPETAQWAIFLRNHDELTLEMVSDEERDYMYRAYARDSKARINLGIRRRLAPLMQNNRRRIEVINFLLFSFPGTPIIYYGDELGMGDNYHLGDRNGVRTPMQWSPDRNAGFSKANPQSLFLPVVIDPEYHYEVVNVETQERNQTSLLWWMRRLISTYKTEPALGKGRLKFVRGENTKILAFLRIHEDDIILVLVNLSRFAQVAELDLSEHAGLSPVEVFGQTRFPLIGKNPYVMTLGPNDYYWLRLEPAHPDLQATDAARELPLLLVKPGPNFRREAVSAMLEDILPLLLYRKDQARPFEGQLRDIRLLDRCPLGNDETDPEMVLVESFQGQSQAATNLLIPQFVYARRMEELRDEYPDSVVASVPMDEKPMALVSGFQDPFSASRVLSYMAFGRKRHGRAGDFHGDVHALRAMRGLAGIPLEKYRIMRDSRYSTSWVLDSQAVLKIFRGPEDGVNQDLEMLQALNKAGFPGVPALMASLTYSLPRAGGMTLALVREFLEGVEDGRAFVAKSVSSFFERVLASDEPAPSIDQLGPRSTPELSQTQRDLIGEYVLDHFRRLGVRSAELHQALATLPGQSFEPEPFNKLYQRSSYQSMRNMTHKAAMAVRTAAASRPEWAQWELPKAEILRRFEALTTIKPAGWRIRIHGDFHLDSALHKGRDIFFSDFDGDVRLTLGERKIKRSPLRDVASMLVSISLESAKAMRREAERLPKDSPALGNWLALWRWSACQAFARSYLDTAEANQWLPADPQEVANFMEVFLLEQLLRLLVRDVEETMQDFPLFMDLINRYMRVFPPKDGMVP